MKHCSHYSDGPLQALKSVFVLSPKAKSLIDSFKQEQKKFIGTADVFLQPLEEAIEKNSSAPSWNNSAYKAHLGSAKKMIDILKELQVALSTKQDRKISDAELTPQQLAQRKAADKQFTRIFKIMNANLFAAKLPLQLRQVPFVKRFILAMQVYIVALKRFKADAQKLFS